MFGVDGDCWVVIFGPTMSEALFVQVDDGQSELGRRRCRISKDFMQSSVVEHVMILNKIQSNAL